uniref:G_PROTEIN_RECEP_F1_2 domain-containing protein n=1 Tax=Meloidogyne hapla TaxID=6305 RepID=A0A1I8BU04_MELHA
MSRNQNQCKGKTFKRFQTNFQSLQVPLDWALPLYGFLMPLVVAITVLTNSFIVVVLSHRSLRTPTNFVLGAMAISELLTALVCLPWLLYYYTFQGFETDEHQGLPAFWCWLFPYLATILPSMFHTSAIWLTVYLAIQRFIYICMPKLVQKQCTMQRSKQVKEKTELQNIMSIFKIVICISIASIWIYAPELFANYNQSFNILDPQTNKTRSICVMSQTALIHLVGNNFYHLLLYGLHTILVHTLPCILLVFFTWKLLIAIREADKKHAILIGRAPQHTQRKYSESPEKSPNTMPFINKDVRYSFDESGLSFNSNLPKTSNAPRCSISDTKRVHGLRQNTRVVQQMLNTKRRKFLLLVVHSPYWKLHTKNSKTDGKSDSTIVNEKCAVVQDSLSSTTVLLWRERQAKTMAKNNPKIINETEDMTNGSTTPMLLEPNKTINGRIFKEQNFLNNSNNEEDEDREYENEYRL